MVLNREQQCKLDHLFDLIREAFDTLSFIHDNPDQLFEVIYSNRAEDCLAELNQLILDNKNNLNILEVH